MSPVYTPIFNKKAHKLMRVCLVVTITFEEVTYYWDWISISQKKRDEKIILRKTITHLVSYYCLMLHIVRETICFIYHIVPYNHFERIFNRRIFFLIINIYKFLLLIPISRARKCVNRDSCDGDIIINS